MWECHCEDTEFPELHASWRVSCRCSAGVTATPTVPENHTPRSLDGAALAVDCIANSNRSEPCLLSELPGDPQTNVDALFISPMKDVKKGVRVACRVAYELLEDAGNVRTQDMSKMAAVFERKRETSRRASPARNTTAASRPRTSRTTIFEMRCSQPHLVGN